jgi:murein L,D-transpeptidase YafK
MKYLLPLVVLAVVLVSSFSLGAPQAKKSKTITTEKSAGAQAPRKTATLKKSRRVAANDIHKKKSKTTAAVESDKQDENKVTLVRIDKSDHKLELLAGSKVLKTYKVAIGIGGMGPKQFEGDMTTPVGRYQITTRFRPLFHQFIGVSYPNDNDRARYKELKRQGKVPEGRGVGHGIGIHGVGSRKLSGVHKEEDWTHGCIAMDDAEIDEFGGLVSEGTAIEITD